VGLVRLDLIFLFRGESFSCECARRARLRGHIILHNSSCIVLQPSHKTRHAIRLLFPSMATFISEPTVPIRPNAYTLGHARNQSKRYGQVLDTSAEFLTSFSTSELSTPPPLSPTHSAASSSSSGQSSPTLSSGPATPSPNTALDADNDTASVASFPFLRSSIPEVLIHVADGEEGATLEEVRAMGAFWRSLGGNEVDGAALLADAPGDKYRSLIAALDSPPLPSAAEEEESSEMAADELPPPEWDHSLPHSETSFQSADSSCGCDAISRVLADLESEASMSGALAELAQLPAVANAPVAHSSPIRPPRRRPGSGRATADSAVGFSAWIDVKDVAVPAHSKPGKLVKDQQSFAMGHQRKLSAAMSVPDLKARARSLGKKTSLLFSSAGASNRDSARSSTSSASPSVESVPEAAEVLEAPVAGPSRHYGYQDLPPLPLSPIEEDELDTSSALDRLELSLAKLDLSVHLPSPPSTVASNRVASPVSQPEHPLMPTATSFPPVPKTLQRHLRAKQSLPAIPWETYDPNAAPTPRLEPTTISSCPPLSSSMSAPSNLGQWDLGEFDPFAMPYTTPPLASPPATSRLAPLRIVTSLAANTARSHTPSPTSPFVVVQPVPPLWAIDELPSVPASAPEEKDKAGLLKKAVRKAGMVGWWGKQKSDPAA
jgi:hypothetical protein